MDVLTPQAQIAPPAVVADDVRPPVPVKAPKGQHGGVRANSGRKANPEKLINLRTKLARARAKLAETREKNARAAAVKVKVRGKSDLVIMRTIRDFWLGIAARERQDSDTERRKLNVMLVELALSKAGEMAKASAPFHHQKLSAVDISGNKLGDAVQTGQIVQIVVSPAEAQY